MVPMKNKCPGCGHEGGMRVLPSDERMHKRFVATCSHLQCPRTSLDMIEFFPPYPVDINLQAFARLNAAWTTEPTAADRVRGIYPRSYANWNSDGWMVYSKVVNPIPLSGKTRFATAKLAWAAAAKRL